MVIDALFDLGPRRSDPDEMTNQLAESTNKGMADFSNDVTTQPGGFFDKTKEYVEAILRQTYRCKDWLKHFNPALSAALNFALVEERRAAAVELEKKWPCIPAFLALYNALPMKTTLKHPHLDTEQLLAWFGRDLLLGETVAPI